MSKKTKNQIIRIFYILAVVLACLVLISPFFVPIIFGGTLSLSLYPLLLKLEKIGIKRNRAAALITTLFTIIISIPLFFFLIKGTNTVTHHLENISYGERMMEHGVSEIVSDLRQDLVKYIMSYASRFEFLDFLSVGKINLYLDMTIKYLLNFFRDFATGLPVIFMLLLVMVLCIYSFLSNAAGVRSFFQTCFGFTDDTSEKLIKIFIRNSRQVYLSNIITGGVQSLIVATGVTILSETDFFLIFFITLILSFIPVIGAAPVAFVFAFTSFLQGNTTSSIVLVVIGLVTGVIDNILRPWLASFGESRIPAVAAFICVIGGAILFGFPGLFLGLLIGSIAYDSLPVFWDEIGKSDFFRG